VIYVLRPTESVRIDAIDPADLPALEAGERPAYVIHARDLKPRER
jgi:hypothetical protein